MPYTPPPYTDVALKLPAGYTPAGYDSLQFELSETTTVYKSSQDTGISSDVGKCGLTWLDSAQSSETASLQAAISWNEPGSGVESTPSVAFSSFDSGSSGETYTPQVIVTSADSCGASESVPRLGLALLDSSGVSEGTPHIAFYLFDGVSAFEGTPLVSLPALDGGHATEGAPLNSLSGLENASAQDGTPCVTLATAESCNGGENYILSAALLAAESGFTSETTLPIGIFSSDGSSGADLFVLYAQVLLEQVCSASEEVPSVSIALFESGSVTDSSLSQARLMLADAGSSGEGVYTVSLALAEWGTSVDASLVEAIVLLEETSQALEYWYIGLALLEESMCTEAGYSRAALAIGENCAGVENSPAIAQDAQDTTSSTESESLTGSLYTEDTSSCLDEWMLLGHSVQSDGALPEEIFGSTATLHESQDGSVRDDESLAAHALAADNTGSADAHELAASLSLSDNMISDDLDKSIDLALAEIAASAEDDLVLAATGASDTGSHEEHQGQYTSAYDSEGNSATQESLVMVGALERSDVADSSEQQIDFRSWFSVTDSCDSQDWGLASVAVFLRDMQARSVFSDAALPPNVFQGEIGRCGERQKAVLAPNHLGETRQAMVAPARLPSQDADQLPSGTVEPYKVERKK